jgi:hypothetical protein
MEIEMYAKLQSKNMTGRDHFEDYFLEIINENKCDRNVM